MYLLVQKKRNLKCLPYMGLEAILVTNFNTLSSHHLMEAIYMYEIWLQTALCVFRKGNLKMLNLSDLGQRPVNDLDLGLS